MTANLPPIPTGPLEVAPPGFQPAEAQAILLRQVLTEAGVELGAYDERIVAWLATWSWSTVAPVLAWIKQAAKGPGPLPRDCTTCEHHLPAMPAEEQCNPDGCGCTGYPEACDVDAAPPGAVFPVANCASWQARTTGPT